MQYDGLNEVQRQRDDQLAKVISVISKVHAKCAAESYTHQVKILLDVNIQTSFLFLVFELFLQIYNLFNGLSQSWYIFAL